MTRIPLGILASQGGQQVVIENIQYVTQSGGQAGVTNISGNAGPRVTYDLETGGLTFSPGQVISVVVAGAGGASRILINGVANADAGVATGSSITCVLNGVSSTYTRLASIFPNPTYNVTGVRAETYNSQFRRWVCQNITKTSQWNTLLYVDAGVSAIGNVTRSSVNWTQVTCRTFRCGGSSRRASMSGSTYVQNTGGTYRLYNDGTAAVTRGSGGYGRTYVAYQTQCSDSTSNLFYNFNTSSFTPNSSPANSGIGGGALPSSNGNLGGSGFVELRYSTIYPALSNHGTGSYVTDGTYHMYRFHSTTTVEV